MMKKTVLDGKQWLLELLLNGGVKNAISGAIYKDKRVGGSTKEDVVINSLTMTNEFLQNGVFNINIHVPMLLIKSNGVDQYQKNYPRMKVIVDLVYSILNNDDWQDQYNIEVDNHQDIEDGNESFYNFRVSLNAFPTFN